MINQLLYLKLGGIFRFPVLLLFLLFGFSMTAQVTISGTVTAASDGLPLPGVSIINADDTSVGTVTDFDGNYTITIESPESNLKFTYVGFKTLVEAVNNRETINVALEDDVASLDEVVVVGYGTQKRATISGSVASVEGEELVKSPALNLTNTLSGRVSGLFVQQASAQPGYDNATIRIRGTNTYNNTGALVVVDGIPDRDGGLARINPADIETISVLKDASAAIYGARAANGVILITTKRGREGKPKLSYSGSYGWADPTQVPKLATAPQYAQMRNELEVYNLPVSEWTAATNAFRTSGSYTRPDGSVRPAPFTQEDIALFANGEDPYGHPNTDWFDETFQNGAPQQKHTLQLTGGSENFSYYTSLGFLKQGAYYKNSATGYEQYDIRINLDAQISEDVKVSLGVLGREEYRYYPTQSANDIFRMLTRGRPTEPAYWPNGLPGPDIENGQNPVVITTNATGYDKDKRDYFQSNGTLDINIPWVSGLSLQGTAAIDKSFKNQKVWRTPWSLYTWDGNTLGEDGLPELVKGQRGPAEPNLNQYTTNTLNILLGANATYKRTIGNHNMLLLAGIQRETTDYEGFEAYRRFFISPVIDDLFAGGPDQQNNTGSSNRAARLNYYGRFSYDYSEKYLFEFLWRYDGSYLFPEDTRYGFFPGFTGGWVITKEKFFEENDNSSFLNFLKIRGSWGQLGNDKFNDDDFPPNQFLSTYGFGNYVINNQQVITLSESKVPNPYITWEVATNIDLGVDARFLQNRINFEFDVFLNKRKDILTPPSASLPAITGITPPRQNIGEVENRGFDFSVGYNDNISDFNFGVSVNGGYAKNKIIFNDEAEGSPEWQRATGRPINSNLVYGYDGVFATQADIDAETLDYSSLVNELRPGDMKLLDYDGDGRITPDDRYRTEKNNNPTFQGGLSLTASYKNFDLSTLVQGATGGEVFLNFDEAGTIGNYPAFIYNNRWTVDNPSSVDPRITDRADQYYSNGNTYWRQNTNYLRLKNFEIGYSIPAKITEKMGIENFRVYANGTNLFTITNSVFDPEGTSASGRDYPNSKIVSLGANLTF
ncbi:SusC/RagA family TonB-linked outer membrane protein [Flavimarina sp. Hel_I_48]|uniref:SusC/RagA family TonB-linked outer membrane protein n=1 Tax=Flavimarina sp. Hel_I_48 TaxID=1392488 RepID=UPI00056BEB37|nr:TonB-dependent receptor [Flavimarina sp. Hel_I_48]